MCRSNSDDALPGNNRGDRMVWPPHTPAGNRPARSHQGRLEIEKDGPHTGLNPGDRHRVSRPPPVASTTTSRRLYVQVNIYRRQVMRSEEHTSELQSLRHLVCRLLLEKKEIANRLSNLAERAAEQTADPQSPRTL